MAANIATYDTVHTYVYSLVMMDLCNACIHLPFGLPFTYPFSDDGYMHPFTSNPFP